MKRFVPWIAGPGRQVRIAGWCTIVWLLLSPVTMLTALRSSLPWLTAASLFANVATCFGWWVAAWANQRASNVEAATEEMATLRHVEEVVARLEQLIEQVEKVDESHGSQLAEILEAIHFQPPAPPVVDGATPGP